MDWNSDGVRDLISGDRGGYVNVFIQTDTGLVAYYRIAKQNGDTFDVGTSSTPAVMDWNSDGRKDLIIGRETATSLLYLNVGTDTAPAFQDSIIMTSGGSWIIFGRSQVSAFDIDQDGRKDVIYGEIGGYVHVYLNTGPDSFPRLVRADTLMTVNGVKIMPPGSPSRESKCGFCDWNNDGTPDLLIGGYAGLIDLYLGVPQVGQAEDTRCQISDNRLQIEPNPARTHALVRVSWASLAGQTHRAELRVYDPDGRCVRSVQLTWSPGHLTTWSFPLDLRGLTNGVYLVRLMYGGLAETRSLVVRQ
ncbi:MAG: T9SS type A sorting domain-containing protein [candidate division WOR-3 bacterium]